MQRIVASLLVLGAVAFAGPGFGGRGGQGGRGGPGGRGGHGHGDMMPFLQNVSSEAKSDFFNIMKDRNQTIAQIETAQQAWADTNGVRSIYDEFMANMTARETEMFNNATSAAQEIPSQLQQLKTIKDNKDLTMAEQMEQSRNLTMELNQNIRAIEMASRGKGGMGGKGGKMGGGSHEHQGGMGGGKFGKGNGKGKGEQRG